MSRKKSLLPRETKTTDLKRIRDRARHELLTMTPALIGTDWQRDRIRSLEWSAKRLAAMGVFSALAE